MTIASTETEPNYSASAKKNGKPINLDKLNKDDKEELVNWANSKYKMIKDARSAVERQWYTNLAFYFGKQNIAAVTTQQSASGNNFRFQIPKAPPWRVRLISNKIRPIIRTELAKCTAAKPMATIVPASSDDHDIFSARAGEQVYDSIYRRKKVKNVVRRAMFWTLICGNGYIKNWWDPEAVDLDSDQPGDILIEPETPFHVFVPDLLEEELERQPYLIHASTKSADWVNARYGKKLADKINPNTAAANDILENSFVNLIGANQLTKDAVLCLEVWIKPGMHVKFPNGGMFTVLGDQLVQAHDGWPFEHGEYPFIKLDHIPTGKFYSDSIITDLVPLQKEYNRTRSQIVESKNRMARPQLMAALGSLDPSKVTNEPGQIIFYKPGYAPPAPLPLQGLPGYVLQELDRCQADMDDISGQHEVTKGRVPPGVTAATAISYLQEQDDSKLSHTIDSIEDGIEKLGRQILSHVVTFWDVSRIIRVVGDDGTFDSITLKGSDLRGNTDLKVESGSALPTSKAAKQAFIMDLMKMGMIPPEKGLAVLEIGGITKLYDELQVDVRQAQRENLRLQQPPDPMAQAPLIDPQTGQPSPAPPAVPVNTWDNHAIHIDTHNKFRKSQKFEVLDPSLKVAFEQHVQTHQLAMQQSMMQQQMTQQGGPPVAGQQQQQMQQPQMGGQPNG